jgi:gliding motility-associated-like protein
LNIAVTAVNDAPVAVDDTKTGVEDTPVSGDLLTNDSDPDAGNTLSVTEVTVSGVATPVTVGVSTTITGVGILLVNSDGSYTFILTTNFTGGVPTITYTVSDGTATSTANLNIAVTAVNDTPVAVDDTKTGIEDTPVSGNVLTNDSDPDVGATLTVTAVTIGGVTTSIAAGTTSTTITLTEGILIISPDGNYTFTPATNFTGGVPTITYTVSDGTAISTANLNIIISAVNDAPVAVDDTKTGIEDTPVTGNVLTNDSDPDVGATLTVTAVTIGGVTTNIDAGTTSTTINLPEGVLEIKSDGSYTFTPATNFTGGVPTITYTVSDGTATSTANLNITVNQADYDSDGDGIPNSVEKGSDPANPLDTDKDGVPDYLDKDSDGDGIPDSVEAGADPKKPVDTDKDGVPDYLDTDSDGDGIPDSVEAGADPTKPVDTDKDGIPDYLDTDSDGDGIPDSVEAGADPTKPVDTDKDGIPDYLDTDSDGDGIPDSVEAGADPTKPVDTDKDGIPDYLDTDSDGDGIPDSVEAGADPTKPVDTDKDGIPDYLDLDSDNDGILDSIEKGVDGAKPVDTDKDGIPDYLDLDSDGDGITDVMEADGVDADGDGRADGKSDANGVPLSAKGGLNPPDTDKDGKPDFQDLDSDGDGIPDNREGQAIYIAPTGKDSDGDGIDDAYDKDNGGKPVVPIDTDGDGNPDYRDLDSDGDGIPDKVEAGADSTNPLDTDKDGTPDYRDLDSDNDGLPDKVEAGADPTKPVDTDNDGLPDYRDLDSDNDGLQDNDEVGIDPSSPQDSNKDGIPDYRQVISQPGSRVPDGETLLIYKEASEPKILSDGTIRLIYTIKVKNNRPEPLSQVMVKDDLSKTFINPTEYTLVDYKTTGTITKNTNYNGKSNIEMLTTSSTLAGYDSAQMILTLVVQSNGYTGAIRNMAEGTASTKWGPVNRQSIDLSQSGGRLYGAGVPTFTTLPEIGIHISDILTPNNDGYNDKWIILRPYNINVNVKIFNRWGQLLYSNPNYRNDWDGRSTITNNYVPHGTYFYLIELTNKTTGEKTVRKGPVVLRREN